MSDDPTQRLDMSPGGEPAPDAAATSRDRRTLLIVLIVIGAAVLIGLIVTVVLLLLGTGRPQALATASATPTTAGAEPTPVATSAVPRPTATSTADGSGSQSGGTTPQPTGGVFTAFTAPATVRCEAPATNFTPPPIKVRVSWQTIRTDSVWFVQGTSDAADSQYMQVPVSGSQEDFPYEVDFACGSASATYNLTLVGSDGRHVQKIWTVTNTGDRF